MPEKVLETVIEGLPPKEELRKIVFEAFDVSLEGPVVGAVFGDNDRAPGSQNTLQHNGNAQPKHLPDLVSANQVPSQVMEVYGPIDGAILLADSWIKAGDEKTGGLTDTQKRTLIDKAVEKYAFNMTVCESAAVEAIEQELGISEKPRSLEEIISDESDKIDARFDNGETLQVKAGRRKFQGCDLAAKVSETESGLKVEVYRK